MHAAADDGLRHAVSKPATVSRQWLAKWAGQVSCHNSWRGPSGERHHVPVGKSSGTSVGEEVIGHGLT